MFKDFFSKENIDLRIGNTIWMNECDKSSHKLGLLIKKFRILTPKLRQYMLF